ncbi:hypothetical protein [Cellulomonas sp. ATA003]|uniref:hypothetical protein n=1 Tax=Cellulomonas sp. ATA003 TaxID=3073064 RepID=UPI00287349CE|nr:hypothetical protein [Cellulomonas sp. ATA003]WNB85736.1 hypothetical protein REH70_19925 [Cellulomonas sp. ATA003]
MTVHETAHDSVEHGPASDPARTGSSRSPSTVLASRRLRDLVLVVLVVLAFVVTRRDLPLFERTALAESPDSTDFIGVTVATAWLTTAVVLVMGTVLAAVLAGAAAALVHRVVGRLTRDEARPWGPRSARWSARTSPSGWRWSASRTPSPDRTRWSRSPRSTSTSGSRWPSSSLPWSRVGSPPRPGSARSSPHSSSPPSSRSS